METNIKLQHAVILTKNQIDKHSPSEAQHKSEHINCIRYIAQHQLLCKQLYEDTSHHEEIIQQNISIYCRKYTTLNLKHVKQQQ